MNPGDFNYTPTFETTEILGKSLGGAPAVLAIEIVLFVTALGVGIGCFVWRARRLNPAYL